MSTNHSTTENATDVLADGFARQVARSFTIGTDAEGSTHHYWQGADAVVVYDETGVDHVEHLDGRPLAEWDAYVADTRGWASRGQFAQLGITYDHERKERESE